MPLLSRILIAASLALLADAGAAEVEKTWRILPLGNSITQAEANRASYRYPLWRKLVDANVQFDFVGSMRKHQDRYTQGNPPQPDYKGLSFDKDHEGHFGWATEEIFNGRDFDNGSGMGKLGDWLESYDADIALIHLGSNDAFQRQTNESTLTDLSTIIATLRNDNPGIIVLVAKLIPTSHSSESGAAVRSLNEVIPEIEGISTKISPVVVVDQFSGFNVDTDTYDGVHPNDSGDEKMAEVWFEAIMKVVKSQQIN